MPRNTIPAVPPGWSVRFSSLCADTLAHLAASNRSRHTLNNYDVAYRQFAHYLGDLNLTDDAQHFTEEPAREEITRE